MINVKKAIEIWRAGGLVAFPTETVYGLGADAANPLGIQRIFQVKERPYTHPLIVHIAHFSDLPFWACDISPAAWRLTKAIWPGPLTVVLKKQPQVSDLITGGQESIGLRIPHHPIAQALLQAFGGGIAAPSANKFTHISPTTAAAVHEELGQQVDLIIDGGACEVGLESTIIDMSGDEPTLLRPGMVTMETIAEIIGQPVHRPSVQQALPRAPGHHHLHYAPQTPARLLATADIPVFLQSLTHEAWPIAVLTHSDIAVPANVAMQRIRMSPMAADYAHDLYHTLRLLDHQHFKQIIIESVPLTSAWAAIHDRLSKATAKR